MTSKKVAVAVAYVAVFALVAAYVAKDFGWLTVGPLYWTVLYSAAIVLFGAVLWIAIQRSRPPESLDAWKTRGTEMPFIAIALIAIVALLVVEIARSVGYLVDRNLFITLNIALPVLCLSMTYQVYLRRTHKNAAR